MSSCLYLTTKQLLLAGLNPAGELFMYHCARQQRGEIVKQPRQLFYTYITPYLLTRFYAMLDFSYVYFFPFMYLG